MPEKKLQESFVLLVSILKWFILSSCVGVVIGGFVSFFLLILEKSINLTSGFGYYFLLLPFAMFFSAFIIENFAPNAEGHGTEKVITAVHRQGGKINPFVIPVKFIATLLTIAFGGSAGKEGPCAQMGAGISSVVSDIFKFDEKTRKKLVICGISAGFASVFGTPIAGALFGVEVLFVGGILYDVLLPSFISGIVSYKVTEYLGAHYLYPKIGFSPEFTHINLLKIVLAGIFFGIIAIFFIEVMKGFSFLSKKIKLWTPFKAFFAGVFMAILGLIFTKDAFGLGMEVIDKALHTGEVLWALSILKIFLTAITLNFGGSGGVLTPVFFIGATSGILFSKIFEIHPGFCSALGMVGLLSGCANVPITATIFALELFGGDIAMYAVIVSAVSFLMTGSESIYPSQIILMKKSYSVELKTGSEVSSTKSQFLPRKGGIITKILIFLRKRRRGK